MYKGCFIDGFVIVDSLYLHIKYPYSDVFDYWFDRVKNIDSRILKTGVMFDDHVIKNGSSGYKVSVWKHDARIYLTNQVEEKCGDGNGMGAWLQLGPKFIIQHMNNLHRVVKEFLDEVGISGDYPISINRIDVAVDMLGISMKNQDINYWSNNWVGRSKLSGIFRNSRTGDLETFYIESRKSPIFLRVYDKVAQSKNEGDYEYWLDVWDDFEGPVTRVEWEIKPKKGNFSKDLIDFSKFNGFSIRELLNYLIDWGRLCEPNPNDSNNRRWKDSEIWAHLRSFIEAWRKDIDWPTSMLGKEFHGVSEAYAKLVSGTLSGAMAHFDSNDPSMMNMFENLKDFGEPLEKILKRAKDKAEVIKRI